MYKISDIILYISKIQDDAYIPFIQYNKYIITAVYHNHPKMKIEVRDEYGELHELNGEFLSNNFISLKEYRRIKLDKLTQL